MKSTFIYLGILVAMYSNNSFAKGLGFEQNYHKKDFIVSEPVSLKKPIIDLELDKDKSNEIMVFSSNYIKSIEEIIKEDNQIIESEIDSNSSVYDIKTIEEIIKEDNQIIESTISNEVFPLDFSIINKSASSTKKDQFQNQFIDKKTLKS